MYGLRELTDRSERNRKRREKIDYSKGLLFKKKLARDYDQFE